MGMGYDDLTLVFVKLDDLEVGFVISFGAAIFLHQVLVRAEAFDTVGKRDCCALLTDFQYRAFVQAVDAEDGFEHIPGVLLELFVSEAEATVFRIHFEHDHVEFITHFGELRRVLDLLAPGEVGDVHKSVDAFFEFHEDARSW